MSSSNHFDSNSSSRSNSISNISNNSRSGSNTSTSKTLPHTSVVGGSSFSSESPSPVFGAYSHSRSTSKSSIREIPNLSLDSISSNTAKAYPNLSKSSSYSNLQVSPFHKVLERAQKSASPGKNNFDLDQIKALSVDDRKGKGKGVGRVRKEVWDEDEIVGGSSTRCVQADSYSDRRLLDHPGLKLIGYENQQDEGKEVQRQREQCNSSISSSSSYPQPVSLLPSSSSENLRSSSSSCIQQARPVSSSSNLSIFSIASAPPSPLTTPPSSSPTTKARSKRFGTSSSSSYGAKSSSSNPKSKTGLQNLQIRNSNYTDSASSLPLVDSSSGSHSSERFKRIRNKDVKGKGRELLTPSDEDSSSNNHGLRPSSSWSNNSSTSISSSIASSTYSSEYSSTNSNSNSLIVDDRFRREDNQTLNVKTPTQNSFLRGNSSSNTLGSSHSNLSSSRLANTIHYNVYPSTSLFVLSKHRGKKPISDLSNSMELEKSHKDSGCCHLIMSLEGDIMFASKLKRGFFKGLVGNGSGKIELRKGGSDGPIVMQASPSTSKLNKTSPSFTLLRHPSPALIGEFRGLMTSKDSSIPNFKPAKTPAFDLRGDFASPIDEGFNSPTEIERKLDVNGWNGNLKQIDIWGQRWCFKLPKQEEVPLAKALIEKDGKHPLLSSANSSRSNSPSRSKANSISSSTTSLQTSTSISNRLSTSLSHLSRSSSLISTHITSYALGQSDGSQVFEWIGAGSSKWELIERDLLKLKGVEKVVATFRREVKVKEGAGKLSFDRDFPDEEVLLSSLVTLLGWHGSH